MHRQSFRHGLWIVLLLLLAGGGGAPDARAQFRSAESSSVPDTTRSLAPAPLTDDRSLDQYVHDAGGLRPAGPPRTASARYDPTLSRGQKLFWGSVGLLVQSLCDTDGTKPLTAQPDFVLEARERACIHCDRVEDRAWDAVLEGVFSSSP
jgi:hypothetical protein